MPDAEIIPIGRAKSVPLTQHDRAVATDAQLSTACPYCTAQPGEPCTRTDVLGRRHETRLIHPARITRAKRDRQETTNDV